MESGNVENTILD